MTYSKQYMEYAHSHFYCELNCCGRPAEKPHHIKSRGAGGTDDRKNLISLCAEHHTGSGESVHVLGWKTFAIRHPEVWDRFKEAMGK